MGRFLRRIGWIFSAAARAELLALWHALRDVRTPLLAKGVALLALVYVAWPFDVLSDLVPLLGWLDDLVAAPFLLWLAAKLIPDAVWAAARAKVARRSRARAA